MINDQDDSDQIRKDEIFALCEIFSGNCTKENDHVIIFEINEPEFEDKKIKFRVTFNDDYPKKSKPSQTIVADWLPNDLIKQIEIKLDEIWIDNLNEPIVYLWIESIKECVLKWIEDTDKNQDEDQNNLNDYEEQIKDLDQKFDKFNYEDSKKVEEKFEFHHGEPLVFKKSVFQAHLLHLDDESKIPLAKKQLMKEHRRVKEATHNIMAYRIIKTLDKRTIEASNYDDDGETQAGSRLLKLLQLTDSKNVLVIVSRHFGGIKLGPDRFKLINEVAKILLQEQDVICPKQESKPQKGKKKK